MTSIFEGQPLKTTTFSVQNERSYGFQYLQNYANSRAIPLS